MLGPHLSLALRVFLWLLVAAGIWGLLIGLTYGYWVRFFIRVLNSPIVLARCARSRPLAIYREVSLRMLQLPWMRWLGVGYSALLLAAGVLGLLWM